MLILLTNDDGINAPGLEALTRIATELAGEAGEVWTVAPAFEQSGVAHCISYTRPFMVAELSARRFAAEGSPADCVLAALHDILPRKPDLVLSGVNRGNNAGENTLYSGTIGAALEAALQGVPAVALSQYLGPETQDLADPFDAASTHGADILRRLLAQAPWQEGADYPLFYNVNFPPCPAKSVRGTRITRQGKRQDVSFTTTPQTAPNGRRFLWVKGGAQDRPGTPGSDVEACLEGYISVTPMRADLTAHDTLTSLEDAFAS